MIRRPPRSTRTDTLFPDNDALPISRLSGMRPPNYPMMQLKMWLHWVFAERRCHRLPALLTLASKAGSRTVMAGPEQSTMGRWWRRGRPHFPPEHAFVWSSFSEKCPPAENFSAPPGRNMRLAMIFSVASPWRGLSSEERRVGKECGSTGRYWVEPG